MKYILHCAQKMDFTHKLEGQSEIQMTDLPTKSRDYTVKPLMLACPLFREPNKTVKLKGANNINWRPKIGRKYYSISNCMVLILQNKGAKIILHAKSPTFRAAKLKGFTVINQLSDSYWSCSCLQLVPCCLPLSSIDGNCTLHSLVPPGNVGPCNYVRKCVASLGCTQNAVHCLHTDIKISIQLSFFIFAPTSPEW